MSWKLLNKIPIKSFLQKIFPQACILCQLRVYQDVNVCDACKHDLPWLQHACEICALPLSANQRICGNCLQQTPQYQKTIALFHYQAPIDYIISALKFRHHLIYAKVIGLLLANHLAAQEIIMHQLPECVIPIPLHCNRLKERGFNQAIEIAKPICQRLKLSLDYQHIIRSKPTEQQSTLPAKLRRKNIKNAFQIVKPLPWQHVAVVDDVVTTGSTVNEFCRTLSQAGVKRIQIWCGARAGNLLN